MTIEKEGERIAFVVCDGCGERLTVDLDPHHESHSIVEAMEEADWFKGPIHTVKFPQPYSHLPMSVMFSNDYCPDCQADPTPAILHRKAGWIGWNAGQQPDPCDEWPRQAIWEAVGLRRDCGHPPIVDDNLNCTHCRAGYPLGRSDTRWAE